LLIVDVLQVAAHEILLSILVDHRVQIRVSLRVA
jgi:hypothetical protein